MNKFSVVCEDRKNPKSSYKTVIYGKRNGKVTGNFVRVGVTKAEMKFPTGCWWIPKKKQTFCGDRKDMVWKPIFLGSPQDYPIR